MPELDLATKRSSLESLRDQEEESGFKENRSNADRFVREGCAGQWKNVLTPQQIDAIVKAHGEQMKKFGYLP